MRILVLGRKGQVARSLIETCNARGLTALALGRPELDITVRAMIDRAIGAFRPDILVNAAAYTAVDRAEQEREKAFAINRDGAIHAAKAAAAARIPIIHLSTDYVFDGKKSQSYRETDAPAPLNVYGQSKLEGESEVANATAEHLILRTSWIFSPFGHNFVKTILGRVQEGVIKVVDDQRGCPTYALDLAQAIIDICVSWTKFNLRGLFNLTGTGDTTWYGLARHVSTALVANGGAVVEVRPIATEHYPTLAKRPPYSVLDCGQLQLATGIRLPPWSDATDRCVARLIAETSEVRE